MTSINLYPDQERSIDLLRQSLRRNKSVLLQGETGSGKSVMAAYMIAGSLKKGLSSAFVVPRKDLLFQMSETFNNFNIPHSFVADKRDFNPFSKVHICTVGTLVNRLEKINPAVIYLDECHHGQSQLAKIIAYYKAQGAWTIGLSATPEKTNGASFEDLYDDLVCGLGVRELIDLKRLSDYRLFAPSHPDLSKIDIVAGEYSKGQLANYMETETVLIGDAVRHYKVNAAGKLNISFCTSIKHSNMMNDAFNNAGIPSAHMDGETPEPERRRIAKAYANHELLNICSVDLLCFGYDLATASGVKGAVIESMSDNRPTKSRPLQRQKNGRVLRYKDYPAIINDHGGNSAVFGMPCSKIEWTLKGREKNKRGSKEQEASIPICQCKVCYFVHEPAPTCPNCGYIYPIQSRMVKEIDGELQEITKEMIMQQKVQQKIQARQEQGRAKTLEELQAISKAKGYHKAWAFKVFAARKQ